MDEGSICAILTSIWVHLHVIMWRYRFFFARPGSASWLASLLCCVVLCLCWMVGKYLPKVSRVACISLVSSTNYFSGTKSDFSKSTYFCQLLSPAAGPLSLCCCCYYVLLLVLERVLKYSSARKVEKKVGPKKSSF